jgi:hypothetical protein
MVRGWIALFNRFNQRLAMPPVIKSKIDFVTLFCAENCLPEWTSD